MAEKNSTEEKILRAAKKLFIEHGYHDTSMSAIAEKADLGKGTLYWHFDGKGELFQSMIAREAKTILDEFNSLAESDLSAEEVLKEFIRMRTKRMVRHKKTSQLFLDGENFVNDEFKKKMLEIFQSFNRLLENTIEQGIDEGLFYTDNPKKAASAFIGMINGLCSNKLLAGDYDDFDIEENTEFLYNLFLNGLKNKEGEEEIDEDK